MTRTKAARSFGRSRETWRRALRTAAAIVALAVLAAPAGAQSPSAPLLAGRLDDVFYLALTVGMALAALAALALFAWTRRDERIAAAGRETAALRAALDRTHALLDADDQRTIVWDSAVAPAQVFGGLLEHAGAPADKGAFLGFAAWLAAESVGEVEAAIDRLRRHGEAFQLVARARSDGILEVHGRTSGRRAIVRFRELTGERRAFAELKEQAGFVIGELTAMRMLADRLPFPVWRRNRLGRLTFVNAAYAKAVDAASAEAVLSAGIELLPARSRDAMREAERRGEGFRDKIAVIVAGERRHLDVIEASAGDGAIGCAIDASEAEVLRDDLRRLVAADAALLDQLTAGIAVFGADRRLRFHNAAFRALWDVTPEWLATMGEESAILDQLRADRKLPEQVSYREWRARHLAQYQSDATREEWWHLPDGRTLRVVAIPADGGMTYVYENVTEQISLESRLKAQAQLQGETLDHLSEAVVVFGTDGRLRLFNPVFAELWHLSPARLREEPHISEIIAECIGIYADRGAWESTRAAVTRLEHHGQASGRMVRPDGSVVDYATVALPEGMTMLAFVDVTDSARIERVLKERNEALEAADRLKSDFIQHVSYELRSPLQTIIGFSELLSDPSLGTLTTQQREYMDHIETSSRALLALINDILDLATVDAGIMILDVKEVGIATLVESAIDPLRNRLAEQRIVLELSIPKKVGTFHVDEQRVRQILFNLVSNAIRFSNAGGHVRVAAEKRDHWVTFTVSDDGVGIPEEVLPAIFSPFESHAPQGRRGGAGLGLSIVRSLAELHGGDVRIRSEEGKGTTAIVRLPEAPAIVAAAAE
jgi:signal transduction histidine kinase